MLYVTKKSCQWRQMSNDLPPWPLYYCYFWKRHNNGS
ncbi:hypothetical protein [Spirosoma endophyticum]